MSSDKVGRIRAALAAAAVSLAAAVVLAPATAAHPKGGNNHPSGQGATHNHAGPNASHSDRAARKPQTIFCGEQVFHSLTAANSIGPCPGDGLDIEASGITVNLNRHTITGSHGSATPPGGQIQVSDPAVTGSTVTVNGHEQVGINLDGVSNVTIKGANCPNPAGHMPRGQCKKRATVQLFDAGVAINDGGHNLVQGIRAVDNINYNVVYQTGNNDQHPTSQMQYGALVSTCDYGDGITTDDSSDNLIRGNTAIHNGPYSGISMVDDSNGNLVRGNTVDHTQVAAVDPTGKSTVCGASFFFHIGMQLGRGSQDVGIRVEGPGADNDTVSGNTVTDSMLAGISMNSYVCHQPSDAGNKPPEPPNTNAMIAGNKVDGVSAGSAITEFASGPEGTITCPAYDSTIASNTVSNATGSGTGFGDGVFIASMSTGNSVRDNTSNNNSRDGIELGGPFTSDSQSFPGATDNVVSGNSAHGNALWDGADDTPGCDNNTWTGDSFGTANQDCVK